jgi:prophage antirepressor-like protein
MEHLITMTDSQLFNYNSQNVRTIFSDGEPWFVASDVAKILGYSATSAMTRRLEDEDKGVRVLHTLGGDQKMTVITQPGVYEAILGSKVDGARLFRRWITHTVVPAIHRDGYFNSAPATMDLSNPIFQRQIIEAAGAALLRADAAEQQLAIVAPKVEAYDALMEASGDFSVKAAAQLLNKTPGIKMGRDRLFDWLRDNDWIDQKNQPYQLRMDQDLLDLKLSDFVIQCRDGSTKLAPPQVRVTLKGVNRIRKELIKAQSNTLPLKITTGTPKKSTSVVTRHHGRQTLSPSNY